MPLATARAIFAGLPAIDWDNTAAIRTAVDPLFAVLAEEPGVLPALLDQLPGSPRLASMCERYDFMDKLVLLDDEDTGIRVRLHLYHEGFFDRPHNHRWSFTSRIIRGGYLHRLYGADDTFTEDTDPRSLVPICERVEKPGATYVLHHTAVHTVQAEADTVSILVRGPAAKDRFLIHDIGAGRFFWVTGADRETPETQASKQMTPEVLTAAIGQVCGLLVQPVGVR